MSKVIRIAGFIFVALLLCGCGTSEEAIQTSVAQTEEYQTLLDLAASATAAAAATDTPVPTDTEIPTETSSPTPEVTDTLEPGKAFVPDVIGMVVDDAMQTLEDEGMDGYWVAVVDPTYDDGTVYEQEPVAGEIITVEEEQVKLLVAFKEGTPTASAAFRGGNPTNKPCGGVGEKGKCVGNVCTYCVFGFLWEWDCSTCGGTCVFSDTLDLYTCDC